MPSVPEIGAQLQQVRGQLDRVILGQPKVKEHLLVCLLAGGHALLEGVPGTGKTLLGLTLSKLLGCRFRRIQFTPDLMPVDLLGTNVFNPQSQTFDFHAGPIFTDILLADEVNRTPPRTQSALLEAMQEKAATIDGTRRPISDVFLVIATQNPIEFEGTYPLPEAQRDRFLLKITIDYPKAEEEAGILEAYAGGNRLHEVPAGAMASVLSKEALIAARQSLSTGVRAEKGVQKYILDIVRATRNNESLQFGAGPRASLALLESGRALAALRGRDFVTPDDIKELVGPVLAHRVSLAPEAEMEGLALDDILRRIFEKVEVPR
jgi:MoxR-like ATPase